MLQAGFDDLARQAVRNLDGRGDAPPALCYALRKMDGKNKLYFGDNLKILRQYVPDASVDLIYLDPPFNSSVTYNVLFKEKGGEESAAQIMAFEAVSVAPICDRRLLREGKRTGGHRPPLQHAAGQFYNQEGNSLTSPIFQPVRGIPGFELGILRPYRVL